MEILDRGLAEATALRFIPRGPEVDSATARSIVAELREVGAAAVEPVRQVTGLYADASEHRTAIVARPEWVRSNLLGFEKITAPLAERAGAKLSANVAAVGSKATAIELGSALAWLSSKVLGQYDIFGTGRLMLVAPNITAAERELGVPTRDFRLWVALHEETHRVQFGAHPWLGPYVLDQTKAFLNASELDGDKMMSRMAATMKAFVGIIRGDANASLIEAVQTPAQRVVFDRLTALMTLLEGHADVVMDEVGPEVVPSVRMIRAAFENRRSNPSAMNGLARRLLGMDAKLKQYTNGAAFVRTVVNHVGMTEFNKIWSSPETLPTLAEIDEPSRWVNRVVNNG